MTELAEGGLAGPAGTSSAPSPAVAPPPGNPRFPLFDSLRGIAVLFLIAFHVSGATGYINKATLGDASAVLGYLAPILFFVISGFLLYRPYVAARAAGRPRPSSARYARRRVLRIVPAYWTALTVLAIFPGVVGAFSGDWWRYYGFLQLYSHRTLGGGIPVAWTLCVEVAFYVSLPLWAMAVRRLGARRGSRGWLPTELLPIAAAALVGIVIQVLAARHVVSDLVGDSILGHSVWLALGMALAVASVAFEHGQLAPRWVRPVVDHPGVCWLLGAACFAGLVAVLHPGGFLHIIAALRTEQPIPRTLGAIALTAVLTASVVLPAIFGERAGGLPRRFLAAAPVAWIGLISYGIYLWHLPVVELLALPRDPGHFSASGLGLAGKIHHATTPIIFALSLAVTAVVAALSYYLVELPFLRRKEG